MIQFYVNAIAKVALLSSCIFVTGNALEAAKNFKNSKSSDCPENTQCPTNIQCPSLNVGSINDPNSQYYRFPGMFASQQFGYVFFGKPSFHVDSVDTNSQTATFIDHGCNDETCSSSLYCHYTLHYHTKNWIGKKEPKTSPLTVVSTTTVNNN